MARGSCPAQIALALSNQLATEQKCSTRDKPSASLDTPPDAAKPTVFERKKAVLPNLEKPLRLPPFVLHRPEDLVTDPHMDFDWTLHVGDKDVEMQRREHRNRMIRDELQNGRTVVYRSS
eukprot:12425636-Karenia_brevis.AAC.1